MKIPKLIFALKCSVIVYIAACTGIDKLTVSDSLSQLVTKGTWKVNCYTGTNNVDNTCNFQDYTFAFEKNGNVTATKKGVSFKGHWLEDNISKKITINFDNSNLVLNELNDYWDITSIADGGITFEKNSEKFYITSL
ncbi:MAG: hypothetical protein WDM90_15335 [Ferruginibacter sp.]